MEMHFNWSDSPSRSELITSYKDLVHDLSHLTTIDIVSSSTFELEIKLKACHWNLEILGIFTYTTLVGLYFSPAVANKLSHSNNYYFLFHKSEKERKRWMKKYILRSFGRVSSTALHGRIRADTTQVSILDWMIRRILSMPKRNNPGNTM